MENLIHSFFNLEIYAEVFPHLLKGLWTTIWLSAIVIPLGALAGLALALVMTQAGPRALRWMVIGYIDFFRAFPPLVLLILVYFGWPFLGIELDKLTAVIVAFVLNNASYYAEVFRAGIEAVPKGQMEAARSTGLGRGQALGFVVIPQAVRNVLPDLVGNSIEVVKLTTIASVVALPELLRAARDAQALVYSPSPVVLAALMYLVLLWPLTRWLGRLEHRKHR
ncbi:amino acid ABC transporter permease [Bordetella avium]|uniref:Amino acid ABC transporter, permease protein n=1 Tax=Bordetella avium (strain 197N) TaxID=360910 RepID=Q2KXD7_BORA1|nr:amino acid ABC transporter permease [Bordetella avium]AZY48227.1 amino acid ABC transporter permease [Bordetella avium]AZY51610.1 amino acid ABC transporter permease [Bordetella avium]RIQ13527.1 amino acid ABC transporter permease [Bordetella avium]RIQ16518.1 amino acid ABC transporter permease [Bordetella avium]RIQ31276.1 amino acid ABC transporter permease [Bordetella avium]